MGILKELGIKLFGINKHAIEKAEDREKAVKDIEAAFGDVQFIEKADACKCEAAFVTPVLKEGKIREILSSIGGIDILSEIRIVDY